MASITVVGLPEAKSLSDPTEYRQGLSLLRSWTVAQLTSTTELEIAKHEIAFFPISCQEYDNEQGSNEEFPKSLEVRVVLFTNKSGRYKKNLDYAAKRIHESVRRFTRDFLSDSYDWIEVVVEVHGTKKVGHYAGSVALHPQGQRKTTVLAPNAGEFMSPGVIGDGS